MTTETPPFYLVWSPQGQRPPSHRHETQYQAEREAARLARESPGREFYVLAPRYRVLAPIDLATEWYLMPNEDVPF